MSNYTFATVIVADADKPAAQTDLSEYQFTVPLSADGNAPATHWMSSGPFGNEQLELIVNTAQWPRRVTFGNNWQAAIEAQGLQMVRETPET